MRQRAEQGAVEIVIGRLANGQPTSGMSMTSLTTARRHMTRYRSAWSKRCRRASQGCTNPTFLQTAQEVRAGAYCEQSNSKQIWAGGPESRTAVPGLSRTTFYSGGRDVRLGDESMCQTTVRHFRCAVPRQQDIAALQDTSHPQPLEDASRESITFSQPHSLYLCAIQICKPLHGLTG